MTTPEAALAAALVKSDLMRRYMDYAHDAHPLIGRETVEEIAANWAPLVLAALDGWTLLHHDDIAADARRISNAEATIARLRKIEGAARPFCDLISGPWPIQDNLRAALAAPSEP